MSLEIIEECNYQNWKNGERKHITTRRSTKKESKGGMTRWHDKRIKKKEFAPGDKVLLFNSRVKLFEHGKLQSKWEGPFKVINSSSHGAITLQNNEGMLFKVNGQRLKLFLEPDKELEEIDAIYFYIPMEI